VEEEHNSSNALNRQEFLQALVRTAAMCFVQTGATGDMSTAVELLLTQLEERHTGAVWRQDTYLFREWNCYTQQTDTILRKHESSISLVYAIYAEEELGNGYNALGGMDGLNSRRCLLSAEEFLQMLEDLGLFDASFSRRDATLCFVWSRMRVADEASTASRLKLVHHSIEDFYEALVRIAMWRPWPTPSLTERAGFADAGEHILKEKKKGEASYNAFLRVCATQPPQPSFRCLEHLILLLIRTIDQLGANAESTDLELSSREIKGFRKAARHPRAPTKHEEAARPNSPTSAPKKDRPTSAR